MLNLHKKLIGDVPMIYNAIGSAVAAGVGAVGGISQGRKAGKRADSAADAALGMQRDQIDFNQDQLDAWERQFGGIQDNLTDYYSNLDPDKFAMEGKQNLQANMDKQMAQFNESMASQGMQTSGMKSQAEKEAAFGTATGNAAIDMAAPEQVNQMKQGYLNSVEHRRTNAIGGVNSAMNGTSNTLDSQSQRYGQSQSGWLGAAGGALGAGIGMVGGSSFGNQPPPGSGRDGREGPLGSNGRY